MTAVAVPALLSGALLCATLATRAGLAVRVAATVAATVLVVAALVAGLSALAMCRLTVEVTAYQVTVRHPLLPGPNAAVPLRQVRRMRAVRATGWPWTVWWCPWPGSWGRAAVIRSGPALRLELMSGRSFVASVDDPDGAVDAFRRLR